MLSRSDFIDKIFTLYPKDFTSSETKRAWITAYDSVLSKPYDIDFDKLLRLVLLEHKSKITAPAPALLSELLAKCSVQKEVKSNGDVVLETRLGNYTFAKVSGDWNCLTKNQIAKELQEYKEAS